MQDWFFVSALLLFGLFLPALALFFLASMLRSIIAGAPYVPVSQKLIPNLLKFGGLVSSDVLLDLGCGDGRVLISGVENFHVNKAIGYDIALWPLLKAQFLIRRRELNKNIKIFRKNCLKADIGDATFIFLYLFPKLVDKLAYKIAAETKDGIKVLSLGFPINIEKHPEFRMISFKPIENITVYLYEIKKPLMALDIEREQRGIV